METLFLFKLSFYGTPTFGSYLVGKLCQLLKQCGQGAGFRDLTYLEGGNQGKKVQKWKLKGRLLQAGLSMLPLCSFRGDMLQSKMRFFSLQRMRHFCCNVLSQGSLHHAWSVPEPCRVQPLLQSEHGFCPSFKVIVILFSNITLPFYPVGSLHLTMITVKIFSAFVLWRLQFVSTVV